MKTLLQALACALLALPLALATPDATPEHAAAADSASTSGNIAVSASASFPRAEIFGVKLVNGRPNEALLSLANHEPLPVTLRQVGGALWTLAAPNRSPQLLRNLSTAAFDTVVPAGEAESVSYAIRTDLHPQDLQLRLAAVVEKGGVFFTLSAFNETVSVVEAPTSFFDPQILFLYLLLAGAFAGTSYFIYSTWITTLFPQQKRKSAGGKGGERAKASSRGSKKVDAVEPIAVVGADGPAVTTGAKAFDESWIPAHHLQRPESKRVRVGTPSGVKTKPRAA